MRLRQGLTLYEKIPKIIRTSMGSVQRFANVIRAMGSKVDPGEAVAGKASEHSIAERATIWEKPKRTDLSGRTAMRKWNLGTPQIAGVVGTAGFKVSKIGTWNVIVRGAEVHKSLRAQNN
jgi:hypothetical protein